MPMVLVTVVNAQAVLDYDEYEPSVYVSSYCYICVLIHTKSSPQRLQWSYKIKMTMTNGTSNISNAPAVRGVSSGPIQKKSALSKLRTEGVLPCQLKKNKRNSRDSVREQDIFFPRTLSAVPKASAKKKKYLHYLRPHTLVRYEGRIH